MSDSDCAGAVPCDGVGAWDLHRFPHPMRFDYGNPQGLRALAEMVGADGTGREWYLDPISGSLVMTRAKHLRRGICCANGCRHCPYLDDVAEAIGLDVHAPKVIAALAGYLVALGDRGFNTL